MATKTFKIGLSNTDKQNMAQDVYERVLALTFAEYDSANTYNEGDFVVYDDILYQCQEDNVTGTWDGSKWEQATLQDLLDDVEGAVASVNDKANVDGNYPTMTVGVADQLSPYDENSGDDQDEPFSLQATGTGNGTQPDFATGAIALMKEKQGNSVVVNQQVRNPNFANTLSWDVSNGTLTAANNVGTYKVTTVSETAYGNRIAPSSGLLKLIPDHKYLFTFSARSIKAGLVIWLSKTGSTQGISLTTVANTWVSKYDIVTITSADNIWLRINNPSELAVNDEIDYKDVYIIDLTQWFNGDIPQDILDKPSNFFRYYQGSLAYNEGTLVNANGRYIKCIGMNQWDEEWERGSISEVDGTTSSSDSRIRSKNFIPVISSKQYYLYNSLNINTQLFYYDVNKNFISYSNQSAENLFTTPANCSYIKFRTGSSVNPMTTYSSGITISIYYEDESGYDQYYPYEVLTNNDTGTEVLRSAGNVKDYKTPDGTIHRLVGVVDLGTLTWNYDATAKRFNADLSQNTKTYLDKTLTCSKYDYAIDVYLHDDGNNLSVLKGICSVTARVYVRDDSYTDAAAFKTALSGVYLFYELATPTEEQGTTFSENLVIDDFGSMSFEGTNGVPQGALIFYPVDYKAFVDTLYKYTDGTPSNLAKKTDLPTAPQTWAESLPGYDATKTQVLKNVEGTLTWVTEE